MDKINAFIDAVLEAYGPWGVALVGIVIVMFIIQLRYYRRFARISKYKDSKRQTDNTAPQPISFVLTMGEDYLWLENTLPVLLTQKYPAYEIVIVYVGNDGEFAETLQALSAGMSTEHCRLVCTQIKQQRFPITTKTAHNVGIKAASYDNIVLTTPDMVPPVSRHWVANLAAGFKRGDVVIGYCGLENGSGLSDKIMRTSMMMRSVNGLSSAVRGCVYKASIQNLGFRKQLYFENKGFGFLNMSLGEDDLFLQRIATKENTSIVMSPNTTVRQKRWGGLGWWITTLRQQAVTYAYYPAKIRRKIMWEPLSRFLFFISSIAALVVMPDEIKIAMASLIVLRYAVVWSRVFRIARRLGERGLMSLYFIYDLFSPLFYYVASTPKKES